ncbi:hypothetical protein CAPTEDRAFT_133182 [Capitella teleta]|uniref:Rab-GAP TBC domain-containing protein n=1 Tax=Capitella teleta TaxID=283909 RepID=N1PB42_CAPTE|nr:hypothetical protein CAPTEDRAFT_133182 [Capitella teleta]|eukprot:ELU18857.1 hypothetical protein CAPTEDRAFT_133182 [Capitella teleta]
MAEDQEEFEEIQFPPSLPSCLTENVVNCSQRPGVPLDEKTFAKMFDSDGRLVNEHQLRQMTFAGGVEPRIRRRVWSFLFGVYPFNSTTREREAIQSDHQAKYIAMCERWPKFLEESEFFHHDVPQHCDISAYAAPPSPSSDLNIPFKMMKLQADIHAGQQKFDLKSLVTSIQIIDKDVPRTDRNLTFFSGSSNPHLRVIRNILATFAAFNPNIGYAQGMNDILARFILVLQSEVDAYWCFSHFMERMKSDFIEDGVLNKLHDIRELVLEIDPDLLQYLAEVHIDDMTFCHRWMLLCFKREFTFEDSLRCFEMLCSHHLEQNSMQAQLKREQERQKEFLQTRLEIN